MKTLTNRSPISSILSAPMVLAALSGLAVASPSHGANITWSGNVGNWGVAANWTPAQVPGAADNVTINQANSSVTLDGANTAVRSLILNNATAALNLNARTLTVPSAIGVTSGITSGTFRLNASNAGTAKLDFTGDFNIGNGGKVVMDAPATAGNVELFGTLLRTLDFGAGSELTVTKGAGGKRTIFGNTRNAGVWKINHELLVDITAGQNGNFSGLLNNDGGDIRVDANTYLSVKGDNVDNCTFTMKGNGQNGAAANRLLTGKATNITLATFDYQGGLIRNAADNGRGSITALDSRLKLTSTNEAFFLVHGLDSRISTGVKGTLQELFVTGQNDNVGAKLTYEGAVKFENKGKISFGTRNALRNVEFDAGNQQIENAGTVQTLGGGKVTLKGQVINKGTFSVQTPTRWEKAGSTHVNDGGGTLSMDVQGALLELDNTMNNFGNINLGGGVRGATIKGVAAVSNKLKNKVNGKIQPGITNVGGLVPRPANDSAEHAPTLTSNTSDRSTATQGASSNPAVLTIDMGLDCEPGSAIESKLFGLSQSTFDWGRLDVINGGLDLGGSDYNLFLEGFEPQVGFSFAVIRADQFITGTFGNAANDILYPVGGGPDGLQFRVDYNVPDTVNPGSYLVTLTVQAVPTPGTVTLMALAGLTATPRNRRRQA